MQFKLLPFLAENFCKVWGLSDIKIGDIIGERTDYIKDIHFAEPQMETAIDAVPKRTNS